MAIGCLRASIVRWFGAPLLVSLCAAAAHGQDNPWYVEGAVYYDRAPNDDSDGLANQLRLQSRPGAKLGARKAFDVTSHQTAELSLGVASERYPDSQDNDRLFLDAGLDYSIRVNQGPLRRIRLFGAATSAHDDHHGIFNRLRIGGALHMQPAKRHSLQLRTRLGYRDQNDQDTFRGYDQSEFLTDVAHNWRSENSRLRTNVTLFAERRSADRDIYSYDELGLRLVGRYALSDRLELNARTVAFNRDYKQGGREDKRWRGTVGLIWAFSPKTALETYAGYQNNASTFAEKDYEGAVFGFQLSHRFTPDLDN